MRPLGDERSVRVKDLSYENIRILNEPNETILLVEHSKIAKEIEEMEEGMEAELEEEEAQEPEVITARKSDEEGEEEDKDKD